MVLIIYCTRSHMIIYTNRKNVYMPSDKLEINITSPAWFQPRALPEFDNQRGDVARSK